MLTILKGAFMKTKEVGKSVQKNVMSFLSGKPMWVYWIFYSVLSGIMFGAFYAAMYFMALQWWIPAIAIALIGTIWGSLAYTRGTGETKEETAGKIKK